MRFRVIIALGLVALLAACAHAPSPCACGEESPFLSKSKLSVSLKQGSAPGVQELVDEAPRVLRVLDPQTNPGQMAVMREYKWLHPQGGIVACITENTAGIRYTLKEHPKASADDWFARVLTPALAKLAPDVPIVGEEAAHADPSVLDRLSGPCWIVDPIDGTHNYAHGRTPFGIMVALADAGETIAGWLCST